MFAEKLKMSPGLRPRALTVSNTIDNPAGNLTSNGTQERESG